MVWKVSTLRFTLFAFASLLLLSPAAAQDDPAEESTAAAPAEDPSDTELGAFYDGGCAQRRRRSRSCSTAYRHNAQPT